MLPSSQTAFDKVDGCCWQSWLGFLDNFLHAKNLHNQMENLDQRMCLYGSSKVFHHYKWPAYGRLLPRSLHQGEPLSHFLFNMVMDSFRRLLLKAESEGSIKGFHMGQIGWVYIICNSQITPIYSLYTQLSISPKSIQGSQFFWRHVWAQYKSWKARGDGYKHWGPLE